MLEGVFSPLGRGASRAQPAAAGAARAVRGGGGGGGGPGGGAVWLETVVIKAHENGAKKAWTAHCAKQTKQRLSDSYAV